MNRRTLVGAGASQHRPRRPRSQERSTHVRRRRLTLAAVELAMPMAVLATTLTPSDASFAASRTEPAVTVHRADLVGTGPATAAERAAGRNGVVRLPCAPIVARGQYAQSPYAKWADVKNNCGRRIYASIQVDDWPDPKCRFISPGERGRFSWSMFGGRANYAWGCRG